MKSFLPSSIPNQDKRAVSSALALALLVLGVQLAGAQMGNDNPTGPAGMFNGNITTGCSYDSVTGNATRSVTDIVVAGGLGSYPLAFTRVSNSRGAVISWARFGLPGAWQHSYDWQMAASNPSPSQTPPSYEVLFPDGRDENFTSSGSRAVGGLSEQVLPLNLTTMLTSLVLADGGKVEFIATQHFSGGNYSYTYVAQAIVDPFGQRTTLAYNGDGSLYQITEPGGRWIQIFYMTTPWYNGAFVQEYVVDHITASDGRSAQYSYAPGAFAPGTFIYTYLSGVTYFGDNTIQAAYTYQAPNGGNSNGSPLLATCDDPMVGPMKKISYAYATSNGDPIVPVVAGEIYSENNSTTGQIVSRLVVPFVTWRTEIRGDGPSRVFVYNGAFLQSAQDFNGINASEGYDANGFISFFTDRNGNRTDFSCDPVTGNVLQVIYPLTPNDTPSGTPRGTVSYVYGSATCPDPNNQDPHYLYSATDEGGHTTVYLRDTKKRITRINYPDGGFETFTYNASFGEVLRHRMTTGGTEASTYDNTNGSKLTYRDPDHDPIGQTGNPSAWYQYDTLGRLSGVTDTLGNASGDINHTTNYAYNARGQVTVTTHPVDPNDGQRHTITNVYNNNTGTLTSMTDELNHVTSYTYDDYRRVRSITSPGHDTPQTTNIFYDATGTGEDYRLTSPNVTFAKQPGGEITKTGYDVNLLKISITPGYNTSDAATTGYGYDYTGNLTSATDPLTHVTTTTYDERNRPYQVTDPLNNTTTSKYDAGGHKASVTRPNGQVVTFDNYDTMDRLLQQTATQTPDPNAVTKYTYYTSGLLKTMKDPRLVAIGSTYSYSYIYDSMGRKTSLTYPPDSGGLQKTELFHYDTAGRLDTFTNRDSKIQTTSYDQLNRVTQSSWNDGGITPTVTYGYDAAGRTLSITNANATITRAYFNDNLLKLETARYADAIDRTINYTYDTDGRRATFKYPNNAYTFNYSYTARSQLNTLVNNGNTVADYNYDVNGNLTGRILNNSTSSTYGYDALNRATSISHALTSGTPGTRTLTYDYDSVGNRKWVKRDGGNGDVYGYDLTDQVIATQLNIANPDTTGVGPQTINYDANGNRTSFAAYGSTDTYTINLLNQYTNRNTSQAIYDAKGNMTTGLDTSIYTYDAQNRLLTATKGGTTDTLKYDGLNRQISRKVGAAAVIYNVYDGWDLIGEYASGSMAATNAYLFGVTGLVKNLKTNRYYYQDASGSTTHLAGSTGAILEWYRYDLQGTPVFYNANNTQITATGYGVRHLFTGQQWYSEIGLYDLRNRFYSPDIGRFLQGDPTSFGGGDSNLYRYCGNNPVNRMDGTGQYYQLINNGGGSYTINIPINFVGGTPETVRNFLNGINNGWAHATSGSKTISVIAYATDDDNPNTTNTVTFTPGTNYGQYDSSSANSATIPADGAYIGSDYYSVYDGAAHVAGHFMGLDDEYHMVNGTIVPNSGRENDVMGGCLGSTPGGADVELVTSGFHHFMTNYKKDQTNRYLGAPDGDDSGGPAWFNGVRVFGPSVPAVYTPNFYAYTGPGPTTLSHSFDWGDSTNSSTMTNPGGGWQTNPHGSEGGPEGDAKHHIGAAWWYGGAGGKGASGKWHTHNQ
jgi:RHS repeat-associated protein